MDRAGVGAQRVVVVVGGVDCAQALAVKVVEGLTEGRINLDDNDDDCV